MKPGLFPGDLTLLEKHAWNRMVLSYPGERSFVEMIYPGIPDMGPEGRSAVEKQGGKRRAHSHEGSVQARALQDASLSLLYSIDNLSDNIRVTGAKLAQALHGDLSSDFTRRVPAHSVGDGQQGVVVIQRIDQASVLVIRSVITPGV